MKSILHNRAFQHIIFWVFYVIIYAANYTEKGKYGTEILVSFLYLPFHLLFTYTQLYFLIPQYLLKRKILAYTILTVIVTKFLVNLNWLAYVFIICPFRNGVPYSSVDFSNLWTFQLPQLRSVFAFFMICGIAVSIKLLKKWFYENDRNQQIEKEKIMMELEMLKAQVHPHFLFNTLNNLYSLTLTKSDNAPVVVTHLADLLRYMLYECNEKEVQLEKEMEVLKKYIELEKLRYGGRVEISFSCSGNTHELLIAPLILIPFVENSFKHGISEELNQCWININLHAFHNQLLFKISNSSTKDYHSKGSGGIGLHNIKKRLDMIYPETYELTMHQENDIYTVNLKMTLNPLHSKTRVTSLDFIKPKTAEAI
jgi:two-component system, LytTR family, sensor kinase